MSSKRAKARGCVFNVEYHEPNYENRGYYTGLTDYSYSDYISRSEKEEVKRVALFDKNGETLSKNDIKNIEKKLQQSDSIIWTGIISFKGDDDIFNCHTEEKARELIKKHFKINSSALRDSNIGCICAFHNDTENNHIQMMFYELEKKHINSKGQLEYTKQKKIPLEAINNVMRNINNDLLNDYRAIFPIRNQLIENMKTNSYDDIQQDIIKLAHHLPNGRLAYNSENMKPHIAEVNKIVNKVLLHEDNKENFEKIMMYCNEKQNILDNVTHDTNNTQPPLQDKIVTDLFARLGNIVIKNALAYKIENQNYNKTQKHNKALPIKSPVRKSRASHLARYANFNNQFKKETIEGVWAFHKLLEEKERELETQYKKKEEYKK